MGSRPDASPSQPLHAEVRQGFYDLPDEKLSDLSNAFSNGFLVDWYSEQPVGLRLPTGFKIPHAQRFEFAYEKGQLLKILEADWNSMTAEQWKPHPMFGRMSPTEWGQASCKSILITT